MTTFPRSPRLLRGAIVGIDPLNPIPNVIVFQYNPDTVTRTLQAQAAGGEGGNRSEAMRLKGAPIETVKLEIEIDATDRMEEGGGLLGAQGEAQPAAHRLADVDALGAVDRDETVVFLVSVHPQGDAGS